MSPPPPYPMRNRFDRLLADPRSIAASVAHILAFKEAQDNAAAPTEPCLLLRVPPEIRTIIWENVLRGDGGVIHVDLQDIWSDLELATRLNLAMTCSEIYNEIRAMFLPNNTFLLKAKDHLRHEYVLENLSDWLYWVSDSDLSNIGRIVVCTNQPKAGIEYAWTSTGYMGEDRGFVVGDRIDPKVGEPYKDRLGHVAWNYGCWGRDDGHHCTNKHFEMVYPPAEAAKLGKKQEKEVAEKRAHKGDGLSQERAYNGAETVEQD